MKVLFPILGLAALVWVLSRVLTKPSRITYPCVQVATPVASSFLAYLGVGAAVAFLMRGVSKAKKYQRQILVAACVVFAVTGIVAAQLAEDSFTVAKHTDALNDPMGTARGIHPGRVAWVHDPEAINPISSTQAWGGDVPEPRFYEPGAANQEDIDEMIRNTVKAVAGEDDISKAWEKLFISFNERRGNGSHGYQAGQKIAIKLNMNCAGKNHTDTGSINASPHMASALLQSLVEDAGLAQENIFLYDSSRYLSAGVYDLCTARHPNVKYVENGHNEASFPGRIKSTYVDNTIHYSSGPIVDGVAQPQPAGVPTGIATCQYEADYAINMAIMKWHGSIPTLCGKNWFGSTSITNVANDNTHPEPQFQIKNFPSGIPLYNPIVDYMAHEHLGEKTMLFFVEALFGSHDTVKVPTYKWPNAPFNDNFPASLLASQDMVAIDSVACDFLMHDYPWDQITDSMGYWSYYDSYLHEAALADNPESGTIYNPDGKGRAKSLGVHEHWNDTYNREYTGNMGGSNGIQLYKVYKDVVNQNALGLVVLQAELANKNNMRSHQEWEEVSETVGTESITSMFADASTGTSGELAPRLDFGVNFRRSGVHVIWIRGKAAAGNTCQVGLDYEGYDDAAGEITAEPGTGFKWMPKAELIVSNAGYHVVNLLAGMTGFTVDQIHISSDAAYNPSGVVEPDFPKEDTLYFIENKAHTLARLKHNGTATPSMVEITDQSDACKWEFVKSGSAWLIQNTNGERLQDGDGAEAPQMTDGTTTDSRALWDVVESPTVGEYWITSRGTNALSRIRTDDSAVPNMCASTQTGNFTRWELVEAEAGIGPVITGIPNDISIETDAGKTTALVTWTAPTATDYTGDPVPVIAQPESGSEFPIGINTVTLTATDNAGNSSLATFDVTVVGQIDAPGTAAPSGGDGGCGMSDCREGSTSILLLSILLLVAIWQWRRYPDVKPLV